MNSNNTFKKLLEPSQIGSVKTRNRMVKTGATMCYWHEKDTKMSEPAKAFYGSIAKGGIGLLIIESPTIDYPYGARWRERYRMDDDKYINGMKELVDVIHKHGCPTFMQMWHDGPWQSPLFPDKPATFSGPPIGASPVNLNIPSDFHRDVPRQLNITEIKALTDKFASAALRAKKAGFDGVDINAASSHLVHNFLSPFWNKRNDAYGGTIEKRALFLINIIKEIKKLCGQNFAISILINAIELGRAVNIDDNECQSLENVKTTVKLLEEAGADAFQIRNHWLGYHVGGFFPDYLFYPETPIPISEFPKEYYWKQRGAGANMYLADAIKKSVSVPVIIVGKFDLKHLDLGEKILRSGKADFIAMTRNLQADPEFPNKLAEGRLEDTAPCTACGTCLDQSLGMARRCRINAAMGTKTYILNKTKNKKKVVVVGGGPAGMEAARVAALRGYDVTLFEKSNKLGGLMPVAAIVKGTEIEDLPGMIRYLKDQLNKLGVTVHLGREANVAMIENLKPDVVIQATGGILGSIDVPGISKSIVLNNTSLHKILKFFLKFLTPDIIRFFTKFWMPIGKKVVIIGGKMHGFEMGEFLVKRGRDVTIVDTGEVSGEGMVDFIRGLLTDWFIKKGVKMISHVKSMEITDKGLKIITKEGDEKLLEADSIVPAVASKPDTTLSQLLKGKVPKIYAIGDSNDPRMIVDAIADGYRIADSI
jgi:2,4-dienoyl-CoA reductase (NADPH2)